MKTTIEEWAKRIRRGGWREDLTLIRDRLPIGPRNTWSSLAYPIVGWGVFALTGPSALLFALSMTLLGAGSGLYHAFKTPFANAIDWSGMYAVLWASIMAAFFPSSPLYVRALSTAVVAIGVPIVGRFDAVMALGVLTLTALGATLGDGTDAAVGAMLFIAGWGCWYVDKQDRTFGLWGHALWHVFTALAFGFLYLGVTGR